MNNVLKSAISLDNDVFLYHVSCYFSDDRHFVDLLSSNSSYNRLLFINYFNLNGYEVVEDCISVFNSNQHVLNNNYVSISNLEDVYTSSGTIISDYDTECQSIKDSQEKEIMCHVFPIQSIPYKKHKFKIYIFKQKGSLINNIQKMGKPFYVYHLEKLNN